MQDFKFSWKVTLTLVIASIAGLYLAGFAFIGIILNYFDDTVPLISWIALFFVQLCLVIPLIYVGVKTFRVSNSIIKTTVNVGKATFIFLMLPIISFFIASLRILLIDEAHFSVRYTLGRLAAFLFTGH